MYQNASPYSATGAQLDLKIQQKGTTIVFPFLKVGGQETSASLYQISPGLPESTSLTKFFLSEKDSSYK